MRGIQPASLLVAFCVTFIWPAHSQSTDSLRQLLGSGNAAARSEAYIALAAEWVDDSLGRALELYDSAAHLAHQSQQWEALAHALERTGVAYDIHGKFDLAIVYFDSSLQFYLKHAPRSEGLAALYLNYGVAYYYQGDNTKALSLYLKGHELCQDRRDSRTYSFLVNNIGNVYKKLHQYSEAVRFLQESADLKQKLGNASGKANSLLNIGMIYSAQQQSELAIDYLQQAKDIYAGLGDRKSVATADIAMADVYYRLNNYARAEELLLPFSRTDFVGITREDRLAGHLLLAGILNENKKPAHALKWLNRLQFQLAAGAPDPVFKEAYYQFALAYSMQNDYQRAASYFDSAYLLERKMNEQANQQLLQEMQVRFATQEKERELEHLQAENQLTELQLQNSRTLNRIYAIGAIAFLLLSITLAMLYIKIQRQKKEIARAAEEKNKLTAMSAMLEGQEAERIRIARELHDGLGGLLTTVKSHIGALTSQQAAEADAARLIRANQLIDEACMEVRRISHNMVPHALSLSGFPAALDDLAVNIRSQGIQCRLEVHGDPQELGDAKTSMLYRIIQELTQNVIRHADATELFLQLVWRTNVLHITVEDNGRGFEQNQTEKRGLGLSSIYSRVSYLGGVILYDSAPGRGTTVSLEIPTP